MKNKAIGVVAGVVVALGLLLLMSDSLSRCSVELAAWQTPERGSESHGPLQSEAVSQDIERERSLFENPPEYQVATSTVTVACRSKSERHPISGIIVHIVNDNAMATVRKGSTDKSGSVSFCDIPPGKYLVVANDGAQEWVQTNVTPDRGIIVIGDRPSVMVIEFTFDLAAMMWVKFVGDEVCLAYPQGPTPGWRLWGNKVSNPDAAGDPGCVDIWGDDGRLKPAPASPGPSEYCFLYAPDETFVGRSGSLLPSQSMTVYTASHGIKRYAVPMVWAREAESPLVVDCSEGYESKAATMRMKVKGMHGGPARVGCVTLSARPRKGDRQRYNWLLQFVPDGECCVPADVDYDVSVGDFPVVWRCGTRRWSARSGSVEEVELSLDWPTARITESRLTRNGEPIIGGVMSCSVGGEFAPFCRGAVNYPIKAGRMPIGDYPVGELVFVFRQGDLHWRVVASIALGQDRLILDMLGPGSREAPR